MEVLTTQPWLEGPLLFTEGRGHSCEGRTSHSSWTSSRELIARMTFCTTGSDQFRRGQEGVKIGVRESELATIIFSELIRMYEELPE